MEAKLDPMAMLRQKYCEALPKSIEAIRLEITELRSGDSGAEERLRRLAHNLRGTGGTYGFPEISAAGEAAETAALDALEAEANALVDILVATHGGDSAPPAPVSAKAEKRRPKPRTASRAELAEDLTLEPRPPPLPGPAKPTPTPAPKFSDLEIEDAGNDHEPLLPVGDERASQDLIIDSLEATRQLLVSESEAEIRRGAHQLQATLRQKLGTPSAPPVIEAKPNATAKEQLAAVLANLQ